MVHVGNCTASTLHLICNVPAIPNDLTASQTVITTVEENNRCKSFTVNDETTGDTLRLRVPTEKRYEAAGIKKLWDKNNGKYITGFPFELSDEFLDFQKKYLLI